MAAVLELFSSSPCNDFYFYFILTLWRDRKKYQKNVFSSPEVAHSKVPVFFILMTEIVTDVVIQSFFWFKKKKSGFSEFLLKQIDVK